MGCFGRNGEIRTARPLLYLGAVLIDLPNEPRWEVIASPGPDLVTAVHDGHAMNPALQPYLAISPQEALREEDPMTGFLAGVGSNIFRTHVSRFEVDLNRPRERAFSTNPDDTWGLKVWDRDPPHELIEQGLAQHDKFYRLTKGWIESLISRHRRVLIVDLHSYNHRRDGQNAPPADAAENPEIDLGVTTARSDRFSPVIDALRQGLRGPESDGTVRDVRDNIRYPDGGHWPEWVYANYGDEVCTITIEYKKFFMDEWTGSVDLLLLHELRANLARAVADAKKALSSCS